MCRARSKPISSLQTFQLLQNASTALQRNSFSHSETAYAAIYYVILFINIYVTMLICLLYLLWQTAGSFSLPRGSRQIGIRWAAISGYCRPCGAADFRLLPKTSAGMTGHLVGG